MPARPSPGSDGHAVGRGVPVPPVARLVLREGAAREVAGPGATSRAVVARVGAGVPDGATVVDAGGEAGSDPGDVALVGPAGAGDAAALDDGAAATTRPIAPSAPTSWPAESIANQATPATRATATSQTPAAASHR